MTICHALRGASASVGVAVVADLAMALERSAVSMESTALMESARQVHGELIAVVGRLALELGA
jgi:HPt (histidine-containing phosphotransfer) domain-containing protein